MTRHGTRRVRILRAAALVGGLALLLACRQSGGGSEPNHLRVNTFYESGDAAPRSESWELLSRRPSRPYRIGVLFPNRETNDLAWRPVRLGIESQAKRLGVSVELLESDSYEAIAQHQEQFRELRRRGVDAILLAPIHYRAMDALVEESVRPPSGRAVPVLTVINDIHTSAITAKVLTAFKDGGRRLGEHVLQEAAAKRKPTLTIAFFPGPINSSWAPETLKGFLEVAREFPGELEVLPPAWGTPDLTVQRGLVERVLESHPTVDYVVGNAVAARASADLLRAIGRPNDVKVLSTYSSPMLREQMASGAVSAVAWDRGEDIGRLAADLAVRILEGARPGREVPHRIIPEAELLQGIEGLRRMQGAQR